MDALVTDEQRVPLTVIAPDGHDHAFDRCALGLDAPELGWVSHQALTTLQD